MRHDCACSNAMHTLITAQLEHSIATLSAVRADASIVNAVAEAGRLIANAMKKRNKLMVAGNVAWLPEFLR